MGFEIISDEFELPGIGPHYVLYVKTQINLSLRGRCVLNLAFIIQKYLLNLASAKSSCNNHHENNRSN